MFDDIKMFGDLKSAAGVKALNEFLAEHSYIEGYVPSQADTAVFEALSGAPKWSKTVDIRTEYMEQEEEPFCDKKEKFGNDSIKIDLIEFDP